MDRSHEAKIQPFLLRPDWESANSPAQAGYRTDAKLQQAGRAIIQLLCVQFSTVLAHGLWGGRQRGQKYLSDKIHFQHGVRDTRISSHCLSSKLSCFGFAIFSGTETCEEHGITGLCGGSVFTGSLKTDTDLFIAEEIWKFPGDLHMPLLSSHSLNLSRIQMSGS